MMEVHPPHRTLRFLRWFCREDYIDEIEGDLIELFEKRTEESPRKAKRQFTWDVIKSLRLRNIRSFNRYKNSNYIAMFKHSLLIAFRNFKKYQAFSFINVFGLAVAMSVCLLIILMLADQMQFDQFHVKKDRIYRIISQKEAGSLPYATSPEPLADALETKHLVAEKTTQLIMGLGGDATYNEHTQTMRGFFADPAFFDVLSFQLEKGNPEYALQKPNSLIITSEFASRLFGTEDPIGKSVEFNDRGLPHLKISGVDSPPVDWGKFTITGVFKDENLKTHLQFDALLSASTMQSLIRDDKLKDHRNDWDYHFNCYTYVLLDKKKNENELQEALNALAADNYPELEGFEEFNLSPQAIGEITPGPIMSNISSFSLPIEGYYLLAFLAFVVMASACLNYTNLSIARILTRAKEIGVRKVTGASRKNLIIQFLIESVLISFLALLVAIGLLLLIKPAFMGLWVNQYLNFDLQENFTVYFLFAAFALIVGIFAGVFPAFQMSKLMPVKVLNSFNTMRAGKLGLRKILIGLQFVFALFFIVTSILIYDQLKHFLEFEYGFTSENIVNIELQSNDHIITANEFSSVSGVSAISACGYIPATGISYGISLKKEGQDEYESLNRLPVDENYLENLDLKLIAGRNLPPINQSGDKYIIVNEAATKHFGYEQPADIIGKVFEVKKNEKSLEVIGVVKDFRYSLLMIDDEIKPLVLRNQPEEFSYLNLKIASVDLMGTITKLEDKWESLDKVHPFKYQFFDEQLANTNQIFVDLISIIGVFAFLAITIACLGLLGMATYSAERRMKEVSIRKVLGAENYSIAYLLSKEFIKLLAISVLISAPLSYFLNNLWLENFANRVEFGFSTILLGTVILFVLGMLTIGSQTLRASVKNPVDSLKAE